MPRNLHSFAAIIATLVLNRLNEMEPDVRWVKGTDKNKNEIGIHLNGLPWMGEAQSVAADAAAKGFEVIYIH